MSVKNNFMKFGIIKKQFLFLAIIFFSITVFSQQSVAKTSAISIYNNGLHLFNNKAYAAAQNTFLKLQNSPLNSTYLNADVAYYEAICAVKLQQPDADKKIVAFVEKYPNSAKKNSAFFEVGNYYFANKKAAHALKWYQKVDENFLSDDNKKELNFKKGYGFFVSKEYEAAQKHFLSLINDAKYGNDARYYYGYISYTLEDYGLAEKTLKEIEDSPTYKAEISYYLLDISFKAAKFERCVVMGKELLETKKSKETAEISKIIGESYFNLKKYKEAIPYLKAYNGRKIVWNNTDYYQLGYAYYKQNDFENAVSYFNKIIGEKNAVAQNAYYHLGECYLNLDKKAEALNAFKSASEMSFNSEIKEDASLNYAKLSYETGNPFKSVAEVLQDYLKAYPKSSSAQEISNLVVTSYIHQQDYDGALSFLKKKKTKESNALLLEVSFYKGTQLFNEQKIAEALPYFTEGKKAENKEISQKAAYWEAESFYRLDNYKTAIAKFNALKAVLKNNEGEFLLIDYSMAYAYFKLNDYENASLFFERFLQNSTLENTVKQDAITRLGDSYYASRNYKNAINNYKKVIESKGENADYAEYQIGMSYGFIDQDSAKITALTKVVNMYKNSSLKDDALYQLASTYTSLKNSVKAHEAYNNLLEKHPKSIFISKALVRKGLLFYNENENQKALEVFKQVAAKYPNSPDAFQAVANARNIYIDNNNLAGYLSWVETLTFVNVTDSDIDNTTFAVAEKLYFEAINSSKITESLLKYVTDFPNGIHIIKANFYLAETYFKNNNFKLASNGYKAVLKEEQNEFSEEALNKLAQIYLESSEFTNAIPVLVRLEQEAYSKEYILFAQSNLMKAYYETANYSFAVNYAKKILNKNTLDTNLENDANTIIARASFKNSDFKTSETYYNQVSKSALGELKAEALFYNSFFKNQENKFEASNKIVQNLIANYSSYKYWAVKSYVVMGKNYYGLKDVYQATFVLENVIKNFKQYPDIVKDAEKELTMIKENESKTNTSVSLKNAENSNTENNN